jgi:hypothetical protein
MEVWTKGWLATFYLLFVTEVATCRVHFAGCTTNPNEKWMKQVSSLKEECLDRMILFGESSLRKSTTEFLAHYHGEESPGAGQLADCGRRRSRVISHGHDPGVSHEHDPPPEANSSVFPFVPSVKSEIVFRPTS